MSNVVAVPTGANVAQILALTCDPMLRPHARVWLHGVDVTDIEGFHSQTGDRFLIALRPLGGGGKKSGLGALLSIAVAVAAWWVAPVIFGGAGAYGAAGWSAIAGTTAGMYASVGAFAINMIGSMAISALIPPPKIDTGLGKSKTEPQSYLISGQSNQARPFGSVLKVYGRHKVMPLSAANPVVDNVGTSSSFSQLFDFGFGDFLINESTLRIGDVKASQYNPSYYIYRNTIDPPLKYVTNRYGFDQYSVKLAEGAPFTIQTKPETNQAQVNIAFSSGLIEYNDDGTTKPADVAFTVVWREVGTTEWSGDFLTFAGGNAFINPTGPGVDLGQVLRFENSSRGTTKLRVSMTTASAATYTGTGNASELHDAVVAAGGSYTETNENSDVENRLTFTPFDRDLLNPSKSYNGKIFSKVGGDSYAVEVTGTNKTTGLNYIVNITADDSQYSYVDDDGDNNEFRVHLIEYEPSGRFRVEEKKAAAFNFVVIIDFPAPAQYEIQVTRRTPNSTENTLRDASYLTLLESRVAGDVVRLRAPHTMMEMRVNATDKLNGVIQTLSAIGTSVLRVTADGVTFTREPTRNPAWICIDILTGVATPKPISDEQIDWPSWIALAAYCDEDVTRVVNGVSVMQPRHRCDIVIDYETNVGDLLDSILSACRASRMVTRGGKYGVLIDQEKTVPRQLITPKNSWGFSGTRLFVDVPHGLRVSYIDGDKLAGSGYETWNRAEIVVYRDGYSIDNAEIFEDMGTFGITDYAQAWSAGRYMMAQGAFRGETFSLSMDVENLACSRGDLVEVQHDVPMVGGIASYIKAIAGADVTITEELSSSPEGYSVRLNTGAVRTGAVVGIPSADTFTLDDAAGINVGDLIVLGKLERVTSDYLVQAITPSQDLTADLQLVRYVPAVYLADTEPLPDYFPDFGDDFINSTDLAVVNLQASAQETLYIERMPFASFVLTWQTVGFMPDYFDLLITFANGDTELITPVEGLTYTYVLDLRRFNTRDGIVSFELTPYTTSGVIGTPDTATSEVILDNTAPGAVPGFGLDVQDMTIQLYWQLNSEPDIEKYTLRYTSDITAGTWNAAQLIGEFPFSVNRASVGARTGIYFIRATDTSGNQSPVSLRRTTIENLPSINAVATVDDAPDWLGSMSGLVLNGSSIMSEGDFGDVTPLAYYTYATPLNLTEVAEVRLSSKVKAYGLAQGDLMVFWVPLASVDQLASARADQWDVQAEYQVIDDTVFLAEWPTMADPIADPIAAGGVLWSAWRPFEVGDVTGQLFNFRLRVESFDLNVKAVVTSGLVEIDAADRTLKAQNVPIPLGGTRIFFDPPFMFRPTVAVTIDNALDVLTHQVRNVDRSGFDVELFDVVLLVTGPKPAASIAGLIDWSALGNGKIRPASI